MLIKSCKRLFSLDCVMAELEKLGSKYRIALRIVKDPRFERLPCMHKVRKELDIQFFKPVVNIRGPTLTTAWLPE